jgi:hypothetical protein
MPRYFTFFRITLIFEPKKIFYSATGAHYYRTDPNSVFLWITGKIGSIMAPLVSERKIPLLIQCFLIILLVRQSITVERYPELHFSSLGALFSALFALVVCKN